MHFAFVESNTTGSGRIAVEHLLSKGNRVTFYCRDRSKYPFLRTAGATLALSTVELDTNDAASLAGHFHAVVRREGVDAICTFSTFYVSTVAELARGAGLRYLDPEAARCCHDKYACRRRLQQAGVAVPAFRLVTTEAEARRVAESMGRPLVVKPRSDSSSSGVKLVTTPGELLAHCSYLLARTVNDRGQFTGGHLLIEDVLDGPEYSVETMTLANGTTHVFGVTAKHLGSKPHFVEIGHDFPAPLDARTRDSLVHAALEGLAAVGYDFGPAHTEIRLSRGGPVVVEINPRMAGGMIPELVRYAVGVDMLSVWLDSLVGRPTDLEPQHSSHAAIRFLVGTRPGNLVEVRGVDEARALPCIREVHVERTLPARIDLPRSAADRLGFVIASACNREELERDMGAALERVQFRLADEACALQDGGAVPRSREQRSLDG